MRAYRSICEGVVGGLGSQRDWRGRARNGGPDGSKALSRSAGRRRDEAEQLTCRSSGLKAIVCAEQAQWMAGVVLRASC